MWLNLALTMLRFHDHGKMHEILNVKLEIIFDTTLGLLIPAALHAQAIKVRTPPLR